MSTPLTCQSLFEHCRDRLQLNWAAGQRGSSLSLQNTQHPTDGLIGFLNLIRPNTIQLIGSAEIDYLKTLGKNSLQDTLELMFEKQPHLIILADDISPTNELIQLANHNDIPLWHTPRHGHNVLQFLRHQLEPLQTHSTIDRKSTRLNSSHTDISRMPSSA